MQNIQLKASVLESHAAQLRAEALAYLHCQGEEYTECLSELISDMQNEDSEHKRIIGILADIGFCSMLTGAIHAECPE